MKLETNYIIFWRKQRVWLDCLVFAFLCELRIALAIQNGNMWFHSYCTGLQERSFFTLVSLTCGTLLDLGQNFVCYKKEWNRLQWTLHAQLCNIYFVLISTTFNRDENAFRTLSFNLVFNLNYSPVPLPSLCWKFSGVSPSLTSTGRSSII